MRDPLSIVSDGYLSKVDYTLAVVTRGYLSTYAIVVIDAEEIEEIEEIYKNRLLPLVGDPHQKGRIIKREDQEILIIIQIFLLTWD